MSDDDESQDPAVSIVGFLACAGLWALVIYNSKLLLLETNVLLGMALVSSFVCSLPALGFGLAALSMRCAWPIVMWLTASAVVVVLAAVPWHPRKRFLNDLYLLNAEGGLTAGQVRERMSHYREVVPDSLPGRNPSLFFRWTAADDPSRETGEVSFVSGRSSGIEFHEE